MNLNFSRYWETENCSVFCFELLSAKSNDKILWNFKKTPFWALFVHLRGEKDFTGKSTSLIFFLFLDSYRCGKFQKILNSYKLTCWGSKKKKKIMGASGYKSLQDGHTIWATETQPCERKQLFSHYLYMKCHCTFTQPTYMPQNWQISWQALS